MTVCLLFIKLKDRVFIVYKVEGPFVYCISFWTAFCLLFIIVNVKDRLLFIIVKDRVFIVYNCKGPYVPAAAEEGRLQKTCKAMF